MLIYKPKKDFTENVSWDDSQKAFNVDNMYPSMWFTFMECEDIPVFVDPVDDRFIFVHVQRYVIRYWRQQFFERFEPEAEVNEYIYGVTGFKEDF